MRATTRFSQAAGWAIPAGSAACQRTQASCTASSASAWEPSIR